MDMFTLCDLLPLFSFVFTIHTWRKKSAKSVSLHMKWITNNCYNKIIPEIKTTIDDLIKTE